MSEVGKRVVPLVVAAVVDVVIGVVGSNPGTF